MKYLIDPKFGSVYWSDGGTLMFAPLGTDNSFDTADGGEVGFAHLDEKDQAYMEDVKKKLC